MRIIKNIIALIAMTILVGIVMPPFMIVGIICESIVEGLNYLIEKLKSDIENVR